MTTRSDTWCGPATSYPRRRQCSGRRPTTLRISRFGKCPDVDHGDRVLVGQGPVGLSGEHVRKRLALVVDDVIDAIPVEDLLPVRPQGLDVLVVVQQRITHQGRLAEDEHLPVLLRVEAVREVAAPAVL